MKPESENVEIKLGEFIVRAIGVVIFGIAAGTASIGCAYTRNAPLIDHNAPFIDLNIKDSANGNTVTPVAP